MDKGTCSATQKMAYTPRHLPLYSGWLKTLPACVGKQGNLNGEGLWMIHDKQCEGKIGLMLTIQQFHTPPVMANLLLSAIRTTERAHRITQPSLAPCKARRNHKNPGSLKIWISYMIPPSAYAPVTCPVILVPQYQSPWSSSRGE